MNKKYFKNRCSTSSCKNMSSNSIVVKIKNQKIIIKFCESCNQQISNNLIFEPTISSHRCNSCNFLDPISVIYLTLNNMEKRLANIMDDETKKSIQKMNRSIDKIINHVTYHIPVKNNTDSIVLLR